MSVLKRYTGTEWEPIVGVAQSGSSVVTHKFVRRTAGDLALQSTVWANVSTSLDLTIAAATGDTIECGLSGFFGATAVTVSLDVVTLVGGSPVNAISIGAAETTHEGVMAWYAVNGVHAFLGGSHLYTLQSGDISGGTVTLRLRYKSGAAVARTLSASSTVPLLFYVKNLGPAAA